MALLTQRLIKGLLANQEPGTASAGMRPERIVLPGTGAEEAPVRIYVGTEPGQHRAERVFVWSIAQARDPGRRYEIYLMKALPGFRRRWWLTGFTNYRFAVPHLAGGRGRAIYNDVDQIYLIDPARLFDAEMNGCGFLSINDRDTSVMLIDCARMGAIWGLDDAQRERRRTLEARASTVPGLWGPLDPGWNARDEEYRPGQSKLVHFTTLHTQPWRPFPKDYVYQRNPVGDLWSAMERAADEAGFRLFTRGHPSDRYRQWLESRSGRESSEAPREQAFDEPASPSERRALCDLLVNSGARTALDFGASPTGIESTTFTVTRRTPRRPPWNDVDRARFDGVICRGVLESLPDEDLPWVIDALFEQTGGFLYVAADVSRTRARTADRRLRDASDDPQRWCRCFEMASRRHPEVHWRLRLRTGTALGRPRCHVRSGGRPLNGAPRVWVLAGDKSGHANQAAALAEALGWPSRIKALPAGPAGFLVRRLLEKLAVTPVREHGARRWGALSSPWPDVVIASGWLSTRVARWIRRRSGGLSRLVLLGRKNAAVLDDYDIAVNCAHHGLNPHPRRVETLLPLGRVTPERLDKEPARQAEPFAGCERPHIALLIGGSSRQCRLDSATARRLGGAVSAFAGEAGGTVFALTSRRTGNAASRAIKRALAPSARFYAWRRGDPGNPYLACLAAADVLVVTGESESMLADAAATGKPLYIYPLPVRATLWQRLSAWVARHAQARRVNRRGSVRPQQGLQYFCARLIERRAVLPPRDLRGLHQQLFERGIAQPFGAPLCLEPRPPLDEAGDAAAQVRALLGITEPVPAAKRSLPSYRRFGRRYEAVLQPLHAVRADGIPNG